MFIFNELKTNSKFLLTSLSYFRELVVVVYKGAVYYLDVDNLSTGRSGWQTLPVLDTDVDWKSAKVGMDQDTLIVTGGKRG